jgi:hypothetical protein
LAYRLFIDEVGNDQLKNFHFESNRFLSLTGIIMDADQHRWQVYPQLERLKAICFPEHPDEACVVLHRAEIVGHEGFFCSLDDADTRSCFEQGLYKIFVETDYAVITAAIDKQRFDERYSVWNYNPYHYCLEVMVERYVMHMEAMNVTGDIMIESRNKTKDKLLKRAYRSIRNDGASFHGNMPGERIRGRLSASDVKLRTKDANIAGLQLVDLIASPCHNKMLSTKRLGKPPEHFSAQLVEVLEACKYRRSPGGRIAGYGQKWLP